MERRKGLHKQVRLKDIANRTGYSINTVSHALRGIDDIGEETRNLILKTAQELGYVQNSIAKSMRLGYTKTIAVIIGDISNPHFAIITKEIETTANKKGYSVFLLNTNEDEEQEMSAIRSTIEHGVDGIILCPVQKTTRNIHYLKKTGIPFVLIGRYFPDMKDIHYTICNDKKGGYLATEYLIKHGHKKILMLSGPTHISSSKERLEGYRAALEDYGIEFDESRIIFVPVTEMDCSKVLPQDGYTAIFAFSDLIAWNAWKVLRKRGKSVPGDVSIIGFDHIQSRLSLPYCLCSISTYKAKMSITSVEMLINLIDGMKNIENIIIDTDIAEGETVSFVCSQSE